MTRDGTWQSAALAIALDLVVFALLLAIAFPSTAKFLVYAVSFHLAVDSEMYAIRHVGYPDASLTWWIAHRAADVNLWLQEVWP